MAQSYSNFDLYKNSNFGPCDGVNTAETAPNPALLMSGGELFPRSIEEFCATFGDFTVVPTKPSDSAHYITWLNLLIATISLYTATIFVWRSTRKETPDKTAKAGYWASLLKITTSYVWWWVNFGKFAKNPLQGPSVMVISWISVFQLFFVFYNSKSEMFRRWRWVPIIVAIPQIIATLFVISKRFTGAEDLDDSVYLAKTAFDYNLIDGYELPSGSRCTTSSISPQVFNSVQVLRAARSQAVIGAVTFAWTVFAWIGLALLSFCGCNLTRWGSENHSKSHIAMRVGWLVLLSLAIFAVLIEAGYSADVLGEGQPMGWDVNCGVLALHMNSRVGFYDVKVEKVFESIFVVG